MYGVKTRTKDQLGLSGCTELRPGTALPSVGIDVYVCEMTWDMFVSCWMSFGKKSCCLFSVRHQGTFTGKGDRRKTEKIGEIVSYDHSAH